ncbi:lipid-A-disaccharide synthase [Terracidiphilus sp.]|jgi:lipid-A-disaccharide synthase|uniref:lipid-A-disaccharide synthase n=1 Tax=Terracidiphilus sp. TaxID=1964191 RepID=UPI003C1E55B8
MPTLFISAGEASGEHYGAMLMESLRKQSPAELNFIGMGGPRMVEAGLDRIVRAEDVAVMGITEIVRHLPRIYSEFRKLKASIRRRKPDIAILIDFPDIHFALAKEFHAQGIPVIFFVSPQLWAWKKHRIKLVQKYIDKMLVIFPFEEPFYRERNVSAEFVGHPLADLPLPTISRDQFALESGLDSTKQWIGLLPGSRIKEIRANLPETLKAAFFLHDDYAENARLGLQWPEPEFLLPLAPTLTTTQREEVRQLIATHMPGLPIHLVHDARDALHHARASIVASGTATVEAALIGNPFVVVYRVSPLTYAIAKRVVTVPHVAMANLIAGRRLVPELIQNDFTASNIVRELRPLLSDGPERASMMQGLAALRGMLNPHHGQTAIYRVAEIVLQQLSLTPAATALVEKS